MTTAAQPRPARAKAARIVIAGTNKPIRFRFIQNTVWKVVVGLLAASVVAGAYFGFFEVNWYVHIGPIHFTILHLKPAWDRGSFIRFLIPARDWNTYRHVAFRNLLEPEVGIIAVLTLIAKPKYWGKRASLPHLIAGPFILLAAAIVLNMCGVWLLYSVWPGAFWNTGELAKLSVAQLALGFVIGRVLHPIWAPVGSTLQEFQLERTLSRARKRKHVPLWVELPVAPPTLRERFSKMWREVITVKKTGGTHRLALTVISTILFLFMLLGLAGHYYVGVLGHTIPYLAP